MHINTNIAAINTQRHMYQTNMNLDRTLERLSSGLRINSGADDASGLAIVEKMAVQKQGISTSIQNTQDGSALFKIAEGAMSQVTKILTRMEELTVRAANQTLTLSDRQAMKDEIGQLIDHLDSVAANTEYNTMKLLNGSLDVKKSLTQTVGTPGTIKILKAPGTVQTVENLDLVILSAGTAAVATGAAASNNGPCNLVNTISINGYEVNIVAADTTDTIISKINLQNPKTGVIAVKTNTGVVSMVSGNFDTDAQNVINVGSGDTAINGSALGYLTIGTAATITLGGATNVWSSLGFTGGNLAAFNASGTNAEATLSGIAMLGHGDVLEMVNTSSKAFGIKIQTGIFNGATGNYIINNTGTVASSINYLSYASDRANISLDANFKMTLQIGANYNQNISYNIESVESSTLGTGASSKFASLADIDITTAENANISIKVIQKAVVDIADRRSTIGAIMNRLEYIDKTLQVQRENMTSAESKIRDADISLEMTNYTRENILLQAGTAMLAQANSKPQTILQLLKQ